jgi:hypothetical protein
MAQGSMLDNTNRPRVGHDIQFGDRSAASLTSFRSFSSMGLLAHSNGHMPLLTELVAGARPGGYKYGAPDCALVRAAGQERYRQQRTTGQRFWPGVLGPVGERVGPVFCWPTMSLQAGLFSFNVSSWSNVHRYALSVMRSRGSFGRGRSCYLVHTPTASRRRARMWICW